MDGREPAAPGPGPESTPGPRTIATPLPASAKRLVRLYDRLDRARGALAVRGPLTSTLVVFYIGSLLAIEARRAGWLPEPIARYVATSHFVAIGMAFYVLVLVEIVGLVFGLAESVARSIGKQVEILSLILLRQSFETLSEFEEPIRWASVLGNLADNRLVSLIVDAFSALLIFVLVGYYYRIQHQQPISQDSRDQAGFIDSKKVVALLLLVGMIVVTARGAVDYVRVGGKSSMFFEEVFSLLIFSDVLIVLISLRYSASYRIVFRNSAFALATVLIRLALTAPPFYNALLGLIAALYTIALTLAYNEFAPILRAVKVSPPSIPPTDQLTPHLSSLGGSPSGPPPDVAAATIPRD